METILVVDDEPDVRAVARDVLAATGYRILEAGNAEEALRVAQDKSELIDLLLTDVVMPGLHGHELAAQLRAQRPGLKILYMSGFALAQAQHEMLETRAGLEPGSPILAKPFSAERLTKKVGEVLLTRSASPSPFARARTPKMPPGPDPWWP
jgi:two-component system, cell cycle sensor histidine kinase and response regulator CckA